MKEKNPVTALGIAAGLTLAIIFIMVQRETMVIWILSGLLITVGGSFGALLVSYRMEEIKTVFFITRQAFLTKEDDIHIFGERIVHLAQKARREGLLVLEEEVDHIDDPFLLSGLQMLIDGFDPDSVRRILNEDIGTMKFRYKIGQNLYRTWGSLAPAFGMIGTLIALIVMLVRLEDPSQIGPGMAIALLTTFYGVLLSNLVLKPLEGKLNISSLREVRRKQVIADSLLALQGGVNPRILQEHLKVYLSPPQREKLHKGSPARETAKDEEEVVFNTT